MPGKETRAAPIGKPYQKRCGKITFIVTAFGNPDAKQTADDLILSMLKNRAKERMAV